MEKTRFYLDCPFEEKDMCKRIGGKWDADLKKWYVPKNLETKAFRRWWPKDEKQSLKNSKVPYLRVVK